MAVVNNVTLNVETYGYGYINGYAKNENTSVNDNIIAENNKVTNDYFWKSNEATEKDIFGRDLDLTSLINKPDRYLKGTLSDIWDVDYYRFSVAEYKMLSAGSDKYNLDITITLDHIPEGCDYELVLYDAGGNQVGIGTDNGEGGKSITIPNWNMDNKSYTVKVQAKDGSPVNDEEYYHLSFRTKQADKKGSAYEQAQKMSEYAGELRRKLHEGLDATEEMEALRSIKDEYAAYYAEQMDKLHNEQAKEYLQGGKVTLADITVENGRIKGLPGNLDMLLNNPGQNRTYEDYRDEILAIKNYEQIYGSGLLEQFSAGYVISGKDILIK